MHSQRPFSRTAAALVVGILLFPTAALAATIATQDIQDTQSGTFFSNAIRQNLGNTLGAAAVKSVAIKLGTVSDNADFNSGNWYGLTVYLCNFDYSVCNNPVSTFSGVLNAGIATFVFGTPVVLQNNNFYRANFSLRPDDTVFGSATATVLGGGSLGQQCSPNCSSADGTPSDGFDPNVADMAVRLCDSDTCDLTPPDTEAPVLSGTPADTIVEATAASTTVTYASPTATDLVDGVVDVSCTPASGWG